jgi:hypothetical protein
MLGAFLLAVVFLFISDTGRSAVAGLIGGFMQWVDANRPFSYLVLSIMAASAALSFFLMAHWPRTPEPDSQLVQYKQGPPDAD